MLNNLGEKVRELREKADLNLTEFAKRSDLSTAYISKLESGEYESLSLKTSKMLAVGLALTLKDFLTSLGVLDDSESPSLQIIKSALRSDGLTSKQAEEVIKYAEFLKKHKGS